MLSSSMLMVEITKDVKESGEKEILYADDLLLPQDSWEEVEIR